MRFNIATYYGQDSNLHVASISTGPFRTYVYQFHHYISAHCSFLVELTGRMTQCWALYPENVLKYSNIHHIETHYTI